MKTYPYHTFSIPTVQSFGQEGINFLHIVMVWFFTQKITLKNKEKMISLIIDFKSQTL
jgi:hypothetical protein